MRYLLVLLAAVMLLSSPVLNAQTPTEHQEASEGEVEHRHFLGAFLGGTRLPEEHGFTLGAEYEFRPASEFGVGVTAETIGGNANENVVVFLGYYHPLEALALFAGGGWDRRLRTETEASDEGPSQAETDGLRGRRALARVGVGYEIPLSGRAVVTPNFSVDFADGKTIYVFGLTVGFGF